MGAVSLLDRKETPTQVVVAYSVLLTKTQAYVRKIEHPTLLTMFTADCASDFHVGRFKNLAVAFYDHPAGIPVAFNDTATFDKWQSGWKLAQ